MSNRPDPIDEWAAQVRSEVIAPLPDVGVSAIASAAATNAIAGAAGAGVGTVVVAHSAAKIMSAVALSAALAGGAAAATGNLPDPIQSWISDVAEHIGIHLPRPEPGGIPDVTVPPVPELTVPTIPVDVGGTVPTTSPLPGVTVPSLPLVGTTDGGG